MSYREPIRVLSYCNGNLPIKDNGIRFHAATVPKVHLHITRRICPNERDIDPAWR